jgi:hypothetical protein
MVGLVVIEVLALIQFSSPATTISIPIISTQMNLIVILMQQFSMKISIAITLMQIMLILIIIVSSSVLKMLV